VGDIGRTAYDHRCQQVLNVGGWFAEKPVQFVMQQRLEHVRQTSGRMVGKQATKQKAGERKRLKRKTLRNSFFREADKRSG
jgi:hypothetical protein